MKAKTSKIKIQDRFSSYIICQNQTISMSLSIINDYQKKIQAQDHILSQFKQRFALIQSQYDMVHSEHKLLQQSIVGKDSEIQHLKKQINSKDKFIEELQKKIHQQEVAFKELYDNSHCLEGLGQKEKRLLVQGFMLQMQTKQIKSRVQGEQIKTMNDALNSKKQIIKKILNENRQLKESILKLTHQHNLKTVDLNKKIAQLSIISRQPESTKIPSEQSKQQSFTFQKLTSSYLLQIRTIQLQSLKQKYQKLIQTNKLLIFRDKQLQRLLEQSRRQYEPTQIDQAYCSYSKLVKENAELRQDIAILDGSKLQEIKQKINTYMRKGKYLESLEKENLDLRKQLILQWSSLLKKYQSSEITQLHLKQKQLQTRIQKYKRILMRYDDAFRKINPTFEIYEYSMMNLDWVSSKILTDDDVKQCSQISARKAKLDQQNRQIRFRQQELKTQGENLFKKFEDFIKNNKSTSLNQGNQENSVPRQDETLMEKIIEKSQQKINQLLQIINCLRKNQLIVESQKRYLMEQRPILSSKKDYIVIESQPPVNFLSLSSIQIPNVVLNNMNTDIPSLIQSLQQRNNKCLESIDNLIYQHRTYLSTMNLNNHKLNNLTKELYDQHATNQRLKKLVEEKQFQINQLEGTLKQSEETQQKKLDQVGNTSIIDTGLMYSGSSDISGELINQLSIVLNHNQSITSKLVQELQVLKQSYTKLQTINSQSSKLNKDILHENSILKLKLTEAILAIQTSGQNQKEVINQVQLMKSQNQRLKKDCQDKEIYNNKLRETIDNDLSKLTSSIETNFSSFHKQGEMIEGPIDANSPTLLQVIDSLKTLVNQKNKQIIHLRDVNIRMTQDIISIKKQNVTKKYAENKNDAISNERDLSNLLQKTIEVINALKQK